MKTNPHSTTRSLVLAALFLALAFVLPMITGHVPQVGNMPVSYTHLDVYKRQAFAKAGVQQLVHIGRSLCEDVLAHDAHIGGTVLHIDGNVAGLDEEVADAGLRVFHHQLAGGVVVLRAAVADARQQVIHLIADVYKRQVPHGPL